MQFSLKRLLLAVVYFAVSAALLANIMRWAKFSDGESPFAMLLLEYVWASALAGAGVGTLADKAWQCASLAMSIGLGMAVVWLS
jgi:hypothetical protein